MHWIVRSFAFAVFAVIIALIWFESGSDNYTEVRMPDDIDAKREAFKEMNKTAFVLGATGETGKELVKELLRSKVFSRVTLIGRREIKYEDELYKDVEQKVIDFEKTDGNEYADVFQGYDVGYSCLGTTRGKAGADGFYRVDHDYVMNTAKLALGGGCKHFHLVSSKGADAKSSLLYTKTKGQVEEELKELGFDRLSIYRPGVLMCDREERRFGEACFRWLLKPIAAVSPTLMTTSTTTLAKALVNCATLPTQEKVELFDIRSIMVLAGEIS